MLALRNPNNLTFFTTGTCDFSTYDNPDFTSAGEQVLTDNPRAAPWACSPPPAWSMPARTPA